jgi:lysozyme family protein
VSALLARVLETTFGLEGGFSDDPSDKGGRTQWGIAEKRHPELWALGPPTKAAATQFYTGLWNECGSAYLESAGLIELAHNLFDMAVNAGPKRAVVLLQRAAGIADLDGILGPLTLSAVRALAAAFGEPALRNAYLLERVAFYTRLVARDPSQQKFFRGWIGRALSFYPTNKQVH